ncbi:MAG: small subunit ribosomal protein [Candidatus Woesearchaeota archaeon]|nr:small subunit ribosomal protein [Candidatus Woesearchaeota archaeon]
MAEDEMMLISSDEYLKSGIHIGTQFKTKYLDDFIYKTRVDGLSVFNISSVDKRIAMAIKFLGHYKPEDILVCGRRESCWKPIKVFSKHTGAKTIIGRYPPGILTNPSLNNFIEAKIMIVCDPWTDKNAIHDALAIGIPVVAICDTNNTTNNVDFVIPANNKGKKSLALIFFLLARGLLKEWGKIKDDSEFKGSLDDFNE